MKILVTGGSGHLGANLVRRLLADGIDVRALERSGSNNAALDGLALERVTGDLRDYESLERAVKGVQRIYHCAARLTTVDGGEQELFDCNVLGTRNLLRAAREAGVGRVVVTGSFSAVGHRHDRPSDESVPFNPFDKAMPYEKSKAGVEHECLKACVEGQDVVIATSCAILGPNDFKPSRMGRVLVDYANGKLRAYIPGGFEFVSSHDMVQGHLLAMQKGRTGQKYIFSTRFMTTDDLMSIYERITGQRRPRLRLPPTVMSAIAHITQPILSMLRPQSPQRFTPGAVRILRMHRHADTTKAKTELGFVPSSIEDAIRDQYEFFIRLGWIHGSAARSTYERAEPDQPARKSAADV